MEEFVIKTNKKRQIVDITEKIKEKITIRNGICLIYVPHTTASLIVNEFEPKIEQDYITFFKNLIKDEKYKHNIIDNNAEAHLLSALFGTSKQFIIKENILVLGTWQRILFCEFDGPRTRRIIVKCQK